MDAYDARSEALKLAHTVIQSGVLKMYGPVNHNSPESGAQADAEYIFKFIQDLTVKLQTV